jgi:trans-aconitate 2-methyltransferase
MLLARLPRGEVVAVDGSASMVAEVRERLGDRVEALVSDLVALELDRPVDAVLSTATFHWIHDHDALFARLHAALRPGGALVAQCGGAGNIASVQHAIDAAARGTALEGWEGPWHYATPAATAARLRAAGFADVWTWPQPFPVTPPEPRAYFRTVMLGAHLERLGEDEREPFLDAVMRGLDDPPVVDYVRLNILARRRGPTRPAAS